MLTNLIIVVSTHYQDTTDPNLTRLSDQAVAYKTDFLPCHDDLPELQYVMTQLANIIEAYKEEQSIDEEPIYIATWFTDKPTYDVEFTPELRVVK